jgi:peptidoglycan/LPS O-acetylase OafA/YrhL
MSRNLASLLASLALGVIGLNLVFSDLGAGESSINRIFVSAVFFFLCGIGIGYFNPRGWVISGLCAWGSTLFGTLIVMNAIRKYGGNALSAQEPPYISSGLIILLVPLSLALLGGYVGRNLSRRAAKP